MHVLVTSSPRCYSHGDKTRKGCDFHLYIREAEPDPRYLKMTAINSTDISVESVTLGAGDRERQHRWSCLDETHHQEGKRHRQNNPAVVEMLMEESQRGFQGSGDTQARPRRTGGTLPDGQGGVGMPAEGQRAACWRAVCRVHGGTGRVWGTHQRPSKP